MDGQAGADGGGLRLVDQAHAARAGVEAAVVDGPALDRRGAGGHADQDLGIDEPATVVHLADEVLDHLLGDFEVGDDSVAHGANRFHVARRAAQHHLGFDAHGVDLLATTGVA